MLQLDDLLHREDDLPRLNEIYRVVFNAMPRPNPSYHMPHDAVLADGVEVRGAAGRMKDPPAAGALRTKLENLVLPAPAAAQ